MPITKNTYLSNCKKQIEAKYQLGNDGKLRQRDLDYLADLIQEKSGIKLSQSTLKRIWKPDYDKTPHPATLNALVGLLGYADWQDFKLATNLVQEKKEANSEILPWTSAFPYKRLAWALALVAAGLFLMVIISSQKGEAIYLPDDIMLKADKTVAEGVPNTVIFNYNLKGARADSFFLQQSWNPANKIPIDPNMEYATRIYYTPGFHWARLVVNEHNVLFEKVHITTKDWFGIIKEDRYDIIPHYLDNNRLRQAGVLRVDSTNFTSAQVDFSKDFKTRFYKVQDFDGIDSDNFSIRTRLKCDRIKSIVCPNMELMIMCEGEIFFIPIVDKGCVHNTQLKIGEVYQSGKNHNHSAYGVDNLYEWQDLELKVQKKEAKIYLNQKLIDTIKFKGDFGKIMGLLYTFTGTGSIDHYQLKDLDGGAVFEDDFK